MGDLFDLSVGLVTVGAEFATDAALFVTTPWGLVEGWVVAVDPSNPSAKAADHALGSGGITCEHPAGKTVSRVIREADRLLFRVEQLHREHGAENLFPDDPHVGSGVCENGRLEEIS